MYCHCYVVGFNILVDLHQIFSIIKKKKFFLKGSCGSDFNHAVLQSPLTMDRPLHACHTPFLSYFQCHFVHLLTIHCILTSLHRCAPLTVGGQTTHLFIIIIEFFSKFTYFYYCNESEPGRGTGRLENLNYKFLIISCRSCPCMHPV